MKLLVVAMAALVGCATGPSAEDLHRVGSCSPRWDAVKAPSEACESACEEPQVGEGRGCQGSNPEDPKTVSCTRTFQVGGVSGCCGTHDQVVAPDGSVLPAKVMRFFECAD